MIDKIFKSSEIDKLNKLLNRTQMDSQEILDKVDEILDKIKLNGDRALLEYTRKFDCKSLNSFKVEENEVERARENLDPELLGAIKNAIENVTEFHKNQIDNGFIMNDKEGILLGQLVNPIERVGVYVPGGTASYPSTVIMNVVPARLAGVSEIVLVTPAGENGEIKDSVLVAADILGVKEIYKIGGAQAVGALCYGTETIRKVDKIVGPGNIYVALAKRKVSGLVGIDMIAGPSEVVIIASGNANPRYIAADLIAQAEHDQRAASIVITESISLVDKIETELKKQLSLLKRNEIASKSLRDYGAIIISKNLDESIDIANKLAPEHLEILTDDPFEDYKKIKNAGAIFLGEYTPEPVGDYYAGPNHTLPTSRTSRFSSALGIEDFIKKTSLIYYSKEALISASKDIILLSSDEGLTGHGNSIKVRLEGENV